MIKLWLASLIALRMWGRNEFAPRYIAAAWVIALGCTILNCLGVPTQ